MKSDIIEANRFSSNHMPELKQDKICGCFYCLAIFSPAEITEWVVDKRGDPRGTALCPKCGIDSVIGESSGFPITKDFLSEMNKHWFGEE